MRTTYRAMQVTPERSLELVEHAVPEPGAGSPCDAARRLAFSVLTDVRPLIETMPLERAHDAYRRMRSGEARFRMVLAMGGGA